MNMKIEEFNTKIIERIREGGGMTEKSVGIIRDSLIFANDGNGHKVNLEKLASFEDGDFWHDVIGIDNHASREHETCGQLMDGFVPRCGFVIEERGRGVA